MSAGASHPSVPWYRHAWPWLLMLPPFASIIGGVTMLTLALETEDSLAVDDYAQIETLNAQQFARDRAARALDLRGELAIDNAAPGGAELSLRLEAAAGYALPDSLELRLQHATRREFDRAFTLRRAADGYRATGEALPAARYALELTPADGSWRLAARIVALPAELELMSPPSD